jgi:Fe2+ transport system protein FeoA
MRARFPRWSRASSKSDLTGLVLVSYARLVQTRRVSVAGAPRLLKVHNVSETPQSIVRQPGPATVRLSELAAGRVARLHAADLAPQDCALLRAIGMTDRCVLRICKVGEPCIVEVRSTRIGLSRSVANGILVVPETAG